MRRCLQVLVLIGCLVPAVGAGTSGGEDPAPPPSSEAPPPSQEEYLDRLQLALLVYGDHHAIPAADIQEMAGLFRRRAADVARDLVRVHGGSTEVSPPLPPEAPPPPEPPPPPPEKPVFIPEEGLVDAGDLDPNYVRLLEEVMAKYGGRRRVPDESVAWIGKKWSKEPDQVRKDLRRVEGGPSGVLADDLFMYGQGTGPGEGPMGSTLPARPGRSARTLGGAAAAASAHPAGTALESSMPWRNFERIPSEH